MYTEEQVKEARSKYLKLTNGGNGYYFLATSDLTGNPDEWFFQRQFYQLLNEIGLSYQQWYDKYILGLRSDDERPLCLNCKCQSAFKYRNGGMYSKFCCDKCYREYSMTSSEYKDSMSNKVKLVQSGEDYRNLHSIRVKNGITDEVRLKMSKSHSGVKFEKSHRDNLSIATHISWIKSHNDGSYISRCNSISRGMENSNRIDKLNTGYISGEIRVLKCTNHNSIWYKSSYEKSWIEKLEVNPSVKSYEWEPLKIHYDLNGHIRNYTPDVLVHYYDHDELQEIKPEVRIHELINEIKADAAGLYCKEHNMTYRFITENDIY